MRKVWMFVLLLALPAVAAEPSVTVTSRFVSDYCWSLGGHTGHPAWQGSATLTWPGRVSAYVGTWWSAGAGPFGGEVDIYAGLAGQLGRGRWDLSALWYDLNPVFSEGQGDMLEVTATYRHPWTPRLSTTGCARWMQPTGSGMPKGAPMVYGQVDWALPLTSRLSLGLGGKLGYDSGVFGGDAGLIARPSVALAWQVAPDTVLDIMVELSWPVAGIHDRSTVGILSCGWQQTF